MDTKREKVLSTIKTIILEETHDLLEGPYPPPFEDLQDNRGDKHAEELAAAYRRYKNELKKRTSDDQDSHTRNLNKLKIELANTLSNLIPDSVLDYLNKGRLAEIISQEVDNCLNEDLKQRTIEANLNTLVLTLSKMNKKIAVPAKSAGDSDLDVIRNKIIAIAKALAVPAGKLRSMAKVVMKQQNCSKPPCSYRKVFVTKARHLPDMSHNIGAIIQHAREEFTGGLFGGESFEDAFSTALNTPDDERNDTLKALRGNNPQ